MPYFLDYSVPLHSIELRDLSNPCTITSLRMAKTSLVYAVAEHRVGRGALKTVFE